MERKNSDLVRVYADDKVLINRIAGNLKAQTGENVTAGDVVADAMKALLRSRPDLVQTQRTAVQP